MKTNLLFVALLLTGLSSHAQTNAFSKIFPEASTLNQRVSSSQTSDGGFIVCGNYNYTDSLNHVLAAPIIIKTDKSGNIIWEKHPALNFSPFSVVQTPDGGYALSGKIVNPGKIFYGTGGLLKLNSQGDVLWNKKYNSARMSGQYISSEVMVQTPDSGFFASEAIVGFPAVCYLKVNAAGDSLWSGAVRRRGIASGHAVAEVKNGGVIIVGSDSMNIVLTRIGKNGDSIWSKSILDGKNVQEQGLSVKQTIDGGFIALGQSSWAAGAWCLAKVNALGDTMWTKTISDPDKVIVYGTVAQTSDQGYVVMGDNGKNPVIYRLDAKGNMVWSKVFEAGSASTQIIHSGVLTTDGGCLLAGYSTDSATGTGSIYILKTDPLGNSFNTIRGHVYVDGNHNCTPDAGERGLVNRQVLLNPGSVYTTTDSLGNYSFSVPAGTYSVGLPAVNYYKILCPVNSYSLTFATVGDSALFLNFADSALVSCPDLSISATTCGLRPCFRNAFTINYSNSGTVADSNVVITLKPDSGIVFLNSSLAWTSPSTGMYKFNAGILKAGEKGILTLIDSVSCSFPTGKNLCLNAFIESSAVECNLNNNSASDCHITTGSMDPNAKLVASQNFKTKGYVENEVIMPGVDLNYLISFQNTGTAPAINIAVTDTLSKYLDPSTVRVTASNAAYTYQVSPQGVLTFTFHNIMLSDSISNEVASHGFIKFSVAQRKGNTGGVIIESRANIVFDYNKPVPTNATVNPLLLVTGVKEEAGTSVSSIYPNPMEGSAVISINAKGIAAGSLISGMVYDAIGKEAASFNFPATGSSDPQSYSASYEFEKGNLQNGMYFYTIVNAGKIIATGKIIIR